MRIVLYILFFVTHRVNHGSGVEPNVVEYDYGDEWLKILNSGELHVKLRRLSGVEVNKSISS